jgi:hypothetical protein
MSVVRDLVELRANLRGVDVYPELRFDVHDDLRLAARCIKTCIIQNLPEGGLLSTLRDYGFARRIVLINVLFESHSEIVGKLRTILPFPNVTDALLEDAAMKLRCMVTSAVHGVFVFKAGLQVDLLDDDESTRAAVLDAASSAVDLFFGGGACHELESAVYDAHMAAVLIQRTWRRAVADPHMAMCRNRIFLEAGLRQGARWGTERLKNHILYSATQVD